MAQGAIPTTKNDKVRVNSSDSAPGYLSDKVVSSDGSVTITDSACDCSIDLSVTPGGFTETWIKTTVDYTDFNTAATTVTITPTDYADLPAGFNLMFYKIKHSASFTGGSVATATLQVRFGTLGLQTHDVFQATGDKVGMFDDGGAGNDIIPDQSVTSDVDIRLTVSGDNADNLTSGSADIWIKIATLI